MNFWFQLASFYIKFGSIVFGEIDLMICWLFWPEFYNICVWWNWFDVILVILAEFYITLVFGEILTYITLQIFYNICVLWNWLARQEWTDSNLKWNSSEYGNVEDIRMPPSALWKPDILMYNRYKFDNQS